MANLKAFYAVLSYTIYKILWQYHHLKEHQPFVITEQSRCYPRIWPLTISVTSYVLGTLKRRCQLLGFNFHLILVILRSCDYSIYVEDLLPAKLCLVTLLNSEQC